MSAIIRSLAIVMGEEMAKPVSLVNHSKKNSPSEFGRIYVHDDQYLPISQLFFTCSKSTINAWEKGVKYVQS